MAKLRKMLGSLNDPEIPALMATIETQSKETLARWAAGAVQTRYLPVYEKAFPEDPRLRELTETAIRCADGEISLSDLKGAIRLARSIPKEAEAGGPAAVAAARAVITGCGVFGTPTNALGYLFYGAAAAAYDTLGTEAPAADYDQFARQEFQTLLEMLGAESFPEEPNPVKINWNC